MYNQQHLNLLNRINALHIGIINTLNEERKDEAELLQQLIRNIKSMRAIVEKSVKEGGGGR